MATPSDPSKCLFKSYVFGNAYRSTALDVSFWSRVPNLSSVTDHLLMVPMPIMVGDIPVQLYETVTRLDPIYSIYPNDVQKPPTSPPVEPEVQERKNWQTVVDWGPSCGKTRRRILGVGYLIWLFLVWCSGIFSMISKDDPADFFRRMNPTYSTNIVGMGGNSTSKTSQNKHWMGGY